MNAHLITACCVVEHGDYLVDGMHLSYNYKPNRSHIIDLVTHAWSVLCVWYRCHFLFLLLSYIVFSIKTCILFSFLALYLVFELAYCFRSYMSNMSIWSLKKRSHWEIFFKERASCKRRASLKTTTSSLRSSRTSMKSPEDWIICEKASHWVVIIKEAAMHSVEGIVLEERMAHSSEWTKEFSFYFSERIELLSRCLIVVIHVTLCYRILRVSNLMSSWILSPNKAGMSFVPVPPFREIVLDVWKEACKRRLLRRRQLVSRMICSLRVASSAWWSYLLLFSESVVFTSWRIQLSSLGDGFADLVVGVIGIRLTDCSSACAHWANWKSYERRTSTASSSIEFSLLLGNCLHGATWASFPWFLTV